MDLHVQFVPREQKISVSFPARVVSTNVGLLKETLFKQLSSLPSESNPAQILEFVFDETVLIDSLGLNLLVTLIQWGEEHALDIHARIRNDLVFQTLDNVWLTQKMKVQRIAANG